ncbi:MAG: NlpC/P60 family protein [Lachnospiraceae bacterium]|nr:NlpC/P60 family protein [Lachnospiraceae bacterium]
MKLHKRMAVFSLAALMLLAQVGVSATDVESLQQENETLQSELEQAQSEIAANQAEVDDLQTEIDDMRSELINIMMDIADTEQEIADKQAEIDEMDAQIAFTESRIASAQADYDAALEKRDEQYETMVAHIQYMYESGNESYLSILLESGDFSELLNRAEYIDSLYSYDNQILTEYEETMDEIAELQAELEEERESLVSQEETLESERSLLESQQAELENQQAYLNTITASLQAKVDNYEELIADAQSRASSYKSQIASNTTKISEIEAAAAAQQTTTASTSSGSTSSNSTSSGSSASTTYTASGGSATGVAIANYALQFVGNPYVWGGTSLTNGCDCSGFVMAVYAAYGYSLPHSSYSLRSVGTEVSVSEAQAGDIVCYSGHVAIYIGNGQIVHAKNSNTGIVTDSIYYSSSGVITVRRVV